jgi:hypothetical protein
LLGFGWGLALTSALRPLAGLCALALLLPFSVVFEGLLQARPPAGDLVDLLALAFAGGASCCLPGQLRRGGRLVAPVALLAVAILTSTTIELRAMDVIAPRDPLLPHVWQFVAHDYWTELRQFPVIRHTYRWLAWLAIAVYAERLVSTARGRTAPRVLDGWLVVGLVGAAVVCWRLLVIVFGNPDGVWAALVGLWRYTRLGVLQPDVNAAGSHQLLFLVPALVAFVHERRWVYGVGVAAFLLAFGLARSRAAILAGVAVLCVAALVRFWRNREGPRRSLAVSGVIGAGLLVLAGAYYTTSETHAALGDAARVRIDLTRAGLEAVRRSPAFGVGLSDYIRSTRRFVTPDMALLRAAAPAGENAHNNFLQITVELGLPAFAIFLWMIWRAVGTSLITEGSTATGLALGILAFLVSALFGHPLLVPLVGAVFFMAVGVSAGLSGPCQMTRPIEERVVWLGIGVYLGSLIWRW